MQLQRLAEQRAAAGEARAQALHGPALTAAQQRVQAGEIELATAKRGRQDIETADEAIDYMAKNPNWTASYNDLRKQNPKLWTTLDTFAQKKTAADAAANTSRVEYDKKRFDLNSSLAETLAAVAPTVKDQATYERWLRPLMQNNPEVANSIPMEYSPDNFGVAKNVVDRLRQFKVVRLPTGDDAVFDPVEKKFISTLTETGPQPFTGPQPVTPKTAAAAPPQTVTFRGGMESLSDTGRNAAQSVLQNFPGARITSGLRTPERNAAVGGAAKSYHLTGDAIDVVPPAGMPMNVFAAQLQQQLGPQGYTVMYGDPGHLDHIHIQPGRGMNVPRQFSPSVAATDVAAGRQPMGMMAPGAAAPANAMAPLVAAQLMQQNAMTQPQALPNIAPGLTPAQQAKVAGIEAEAEARERGQIKAKKEQTQAEKEVTRGEFDTNLDAILGAYRQLGSQGMLTTKDTPFSERAKTAVMANLPVGATTAISPERGEPYGIIQNNRQIMLSALMGATGMTAKQIDSNAEMKNWLNALSSPDQTAGSILTTLNTLSKRFGSGRQFSETDLGMAPQGRGKAGEEAPKAAKPSLQEFLTKAKPANPNVSEAELKAYYERTYGAR